MPKVEKKEEPYIKPIREEIVEDVLQDILGSSEDVRIAWMALPSAVRDRLRIKWLNTIQQWLDIIKVWG